MHGSMAEQLRNVRIAPVKTVSKNLPPPKSFHSFVHSRKDLEVMHHEQMQREMHALNIDEEEGSVEKPAQVTMDRKGLIKLKKGQKFNLMFGYPLKHKPSEVPLELLCFGDLDTRRDGWRHTEHFATARIDIKGLIERVCVDSIFLVEENKDFCQVRMECTVGLVKHRTGFNRFKETAYERIVRKALQNTWASANLKRSEEGASLYLRRIANVPQVSISFAIE